MCEKSLQPKTNLWDHKRCLAHRWFCTIFCCLSVRVHRHLSKWIMMGERLTKIVSVNIALVLSTQLLLSDKNKYNCISLPLDCLRLYAMQSTTNTKLFVECVLCTQRLFSCALKWHQVYKGDWPILLDIYEFLIWTTIWFST